jgi:hypothetical protein
MAGAESGGQRPRGQVLNGAERDQRPADHRPGGKIVEQEEAQIGLRRGAAEQAARKQVGEDRPQPQPAPAGPPARRQHAERNQEGTQQRPHRKLRSRLHEHIDKSREKLAHALYQNVQDAGENHQCG